LAWVCKVLSSALTGDPSNGKEIASKDRYFRNVICASLSFG
jgi:hypothetical protein